MPAPIHERGDGVRITVSADAEIGRFASLLAAVPAKARQAFAQGLNEGGDLERTQVRRTLREQTGVKAYSSITKRTGTTRAHAGRLQYDVLGTGKGMPIKEFPVAASARRPVTAKPWGVPHTFKRSFKTSGQGLLRARLGAERMPIRALYGPAVSKEIVKDETAGEWQANAAPVVSRMVMKRLGRLLP